MKFAWLTEPPFCFRDAGGVVRGCDVELAELVAGRLGLGFAPVEASFAELLPGLAGGRWQMTTGLFVTEDRQKLALFSRPIWALADGLLVRRGNPLGLSGYASVAGAGAVLAVIRDQVQHRSALDLGVAEGRIRVFGTYAEAAAAVASGKADAYASVWRAHAGFLTQNPEAALEAVEAPVGEAAPAFGAFVFALGEDALCDAVNGALAGYLGSVEHRRMMARHGFGTVEVDRLLGGPGAG